MNNRDLTELYKQLLDETNQLIQISTYDDFSMIYANAPACSFTTQGDTPYEGQKCYKYMMGLDEQCPFCPMLIMGDKNTNITEVDNGVQVFSVKTRRFMLDGKEVFVEYATDITAAKRAQQQFEGQLRSIINAIPDAQGIFHFDITADKWISTNGISKNIEEFQELSNVNETIKRISSFIPDDDVRRKFYDEFCRESLAEMDEKGHLEKVMDVKSFYDDGSVRWARMSARLIPNPTTNNLECIIYGMDISDEKELEEKTKRDMLTGVYSKTAFEEISNEFLEEKPEEPFVVIFLDIDDFKSVNDKLGHFTGDKAIIETAAKLENMFANKDIISRFGGDEFCIFVKDIPDYKLKDRLDYMLEKLKATYVLDDSSVNITASIGVVVCNRTVDEIRPIIELADKALYKAKENGKNQYYVTEY